MGDAAEDTRRRFGDIAAARETGDMLEKAFSSLHVLVAILDTDFNFLMVNRAYAEAGKHDPGYFVGKNHFDLYPDSENDAIFRRVRETGEPFVTFAKPFSYPDQPERGTTYWDWALSPVREEDGRISALVFTLIDVTARRRTEQALAESESRCRTLVEQASDGIVLFDGEGVILEANPRAGEMAGAPPADLVGRNIASLFADADSGAPPLRVGMMVEGRTLVDERLLKLPGGDTVAVEISAKMLDDGRRLALLHDVSERRRNREEMLRVHDRLRHLGGRVARAEDDERRRIAKDIHDHVGQMLALCQMKLGALQAAAPPETGSEVREIRNYLYRVILYTRSLTFELGSPILYELGLEAALQELAEETRRRHGIETRFEDDGRPKPLTAEMRSILYRATGELLYNVAKHAKASSVTVSVKARGREAVVEVRDDGVGFDASDVGARASRSGGYGLFSIRERLEYLGGSLDIESRPGRGTRVVLRAPLDVE